MGKNKKRFSEKHGYFREDPPITIRADAPRKLRDAIPPLVKNCGMSYSYMRDQVCQFLLIEPNPYNWSEIPNCRDEVHQILQTCDWFRVYDVAELLHSKIEDSDSQQMFLEHLNQFFRENGIGWELNDDSEIQYRGSGTFQDSSKRAVATLESSGRVRAALELREALRDISRRPEPDVTGAIQHCMAALEATARDVTGQKKPTLGELASKLELPRPLDNVTEKLWGYASERARHGREGETLDAAEAELLVSITGALCTFLVIRKAS